MRCRERGVEVSLGGDFGARAAFLCVSEIGGVGIEFNEGVQSGSRKMTNIFAISGDETGGLSEELPTEAAAKA